MPESMISVIMPCFNSAKFISSSIESVLSQLWSNLELIIVDDGSSDNSCEVVARYSESDQRVRLIELGRNRGAAFARNTAIEAAQGRFIAFLDSDDCWVEDKLSLQIPAMRSGGYPLSCTGYTMLRPDGQRKDVIPPKNIRIEQLLSGCDIGCLTAVMDVAAIGRKIYMRDIKMRQDLLLWVDILNEGSGVALGLPDTLATLHIRGGSLSSSKKSAARYQWMAYRQELELPFYKAGYYFSKYVLHGIRKHSF